jgi:hypothetical protein
MCPITIVSSTFLKDMNASTHTVSTLKRKGRRAAPTLSTKHVYREKSNTQKKWILSQGARSGD